MEIHVPIQPQEIFSAGALVVTNTLLMSWISIAFLIIFALAATRRTSTRAVDALLTRADSCFATPCADSRRISTKPRREITLKYRPDNFAGADR